MHCENPRHRVSKLAPEKIAQVVGVNEQRFAVQAVIEVQPAPFDSVL